MVNEEKCFVPHGKERREKNRREKEGKGEERKGKTLEGQSSRLTQLCQQECQEAGGGHATTHVWSWNSTRCIVVVA